MNITEVYRQYLDEFYHPTGAAEPARLRSEIHSALRTLESIGASDLKTTDAEALKKLDHGWLRGQEGAEPFADDVKANETYRKLLEPDKWLTV